MCCELKSFRRSKLANQDGSKSGGRKKGTPNKETVDARAIAERLGVDPFEVLLLFAIGDWKALGYDKANRLVSSNQYANIYEDTIPPALRKAAASDASQYLYPKRKAVELKDSDGNNLPIVMLTLPSNGRERKKKD